uniref:Uncharacterized protein n=1 Tax=Meloidogyne enterolobii TaxID=390850 RepID=A0A6V7TPU7_MELEN|nr:unnamed protein product [Meloidogyne enterolobii]
MEKKETIPTKNCYAHLWRELLPIGSGHILPSTLHITHGVATRAIWNDLLNCYTKKLK